MAAAFLAVIVALVCARLGFWQLDRLTQRRTLNASIARATTHPPMELAGAFVDSIEDHPTSLLHRAVRADGTFEGPPLLIRGRSLEGRPGVQLVVPFRLESGELVLVNQGWLPSSDGATVDPRPYLLQGSQTIEGTVEELPDSSDEVVRSEIPLPDFPVPSFLRLSRAAATEELGEAPLPVLLQLSDRPAAAAELPIPLPAPSLEEGSHFGYAIQWFSFAAIALAGALTLAFRGRR